MATDERIQRREDRLLARHKSYRSAYIGSLFLCVAISIVSALTIAQSDSLRAEDGGYALALVWVWIAVASFASAKLDHIRTIRRYRTLLDRSDDGE